MTFSHYELLLLPGCEVVNQELSRILKYMSLKLP